MISATSPREVLFVCPPSPPLNPLSFTKELTLSTLCSFSDLSHFRQGAALAHLDSLPSHNLAIRTDNSVPFLFGKGGSGVLANCSLCGAEATLSFSAGLVCSSFTAKTCTILQALQWSRQHQQVYYFSSRPLRFLLRFRHTVLFSVFSFTSNSLAYLAEKPFTIKLQWICGDSFLPGNDASDKLARRGTLLLFSAVPCNLSPTKIEQNQLQFCRLVLYYKL